jgi:hypothetical protein
MLANTRARMFARRHSRGYGYTAAAIRIVTEGISWITVISGTARA